MPGLYSHTTRADGLTLTASIYNTDHQNHIDNFEPGQMDDYSSNATQMQTTTNPGGVGSESLATTLAGELERLRYVIKAITGEAQWYVAPTLWTVSSTTGIVWNEAGADLDVRFESDTNANAIFLDAGNSRLGINTSAPSVPIHVKTQSPDVAVGVLETTAANGSGVNDTLQLRGDSLATSGDGHRLTFRFGGSNTTRAAIQGILTGATVGNLNFMTHNGTSLASRAAVVVGMTIGSPTGGDQGAGTLNATGLYVNGVAVATAITESVKAWGYVTYSAGVPTREDSFNVTSITDSDTGDLTVTIATDFANVNYSVTATAQETGDFARIVQESAADRAVGAFKLTVLNLSNTPTDPVAISFSAHGDQ